MSQLFTASALNTNIYISIYLFSLDFYFEMMHYYERKSHCFDSADWNYRKVMGVTADGSQGEAKLGHFSSLSRLSSSGQTHQRVRDLDSVRERRNHVENRQQSSHRHDRGGKFGAHELRVLLKILYLFIYFTFFFHLPLFRWRKRCSNFTGDFRRCLHSWSLKISFMFVCVSLWLFTSRLQLITPPLHHPDSACV